MATFNPIKPPKPIEIDKFLGLNESVGETEIKLGETVRQENFRVTKNYKLQKRPGHNVYVDCGTGQVQGFWYGQLNGINVLLFAHGGQLYKYNVDDFTISTDLADLLVGAWIDTNIWNDANTWDESLDPPVEIVGPITDEKTIFYWFDGKVWIKTLTDWKTYDGTTYQDIEPYTPTVALATPPSGGGTLFEEINLLSGSKTQQFIGDGTVLYQLLETNIDADLVTCTQDGVTKVENVDFTVNRVLGQVTFNVAPPNASVVLLTWTKVTAGNEDLVRNHKYAVDFGVQNDTNIFLFGGDHEKNVFRYSMVGKPNYYPANAFVVVGSDEFAITDLEPQYQSLLVFKQNQTKIVKPQVNPNFSTNTGLNPYDFPYFDLNEAVGNVAPNMVQLIENTPYSLFGSSMWQWASSTGVEDERNAKIISDRIKLSLEEKVLKNAVTVDYQDQKEYWLNIDDTVYIHNYGNDTFYTYKNVTADEFLIVEGEVYFISGSQIRRFNADFLADDEVLGQTIPCVAYGGFSDLGVLNYRKVMRHEWVAINPSSRTSVDVSFITDKKNEGANKVVNIQYRLLDFNNIDFNDWSFLTNRSPQPNRLRIKVKKFTYIQWKMENDTNNEDLTVLKLVMQAQAQGLSR